MALVKSFLHLKVELLQISKIRYIVGILLGLGYSFILYSWFYLVREVIRILSANLGNDLWILSDSEVGFYNLFYAFVAVIIGQSICFSYWLKNPRNNDVLKNYKRISILNDQGNLNVGFLNWAMKMAIVYGIMFGWAFQGGFYTFSLISQFKYFFIFIVLVLFLNTWGSIRKIFKGNSLKWMVVSLLIVSAISVGLSKINLINYKKININLSEHDWYFKYNLQLVESDYCNELFQLWRLEDMYLVKSPVNKESLVIFSYDNKPSKNISSTIQRIQNFADDFNRSKMIYRLFIDRNINMGFVDSIKRCLSGVGVSKIAYAFVPANREYNKKYYRNYGVITRLPAESNPALGFYLKYPRLSEHKNKLELTIDKDGEVLLNNKPVKRMDIKYSVKKELLKDPNFIVNINYNRNTSFDDYFRVWINVKQAVIALREDYALEYYRFKFYKLTYAQQDSIIEKFPMRILEFKDKTHLKKTVTEIK